jgi:vesicle coat complex subunit
MISKESYQYILNTFCNLAKDASPTIRAEAIIALEKMGYADIVPVLTGSVKDTTEVNQNAVQALIQLKELNASKAIFELRKLGEHSDEFVRKNAIKALICVGGSATNAISVLTNLPYGACEELVESNIVEIEPIPDELQPFGLSTGVCGFAVRGDFDAHLERM